jgi:hypothetical protein
MPVKTLHATYPTLPASFWSSLREKWKKAPPTQVSVGYLETTLGIGHKNAVNFLPQLVAIGLVDGDRLTELAHEWRHDAPIVPRLKKYWRNCTRRNFVTRNLAAI